MSNPNQYEIQMLDLMNAERQAAGLNPLVFNSDLNEASEDHSRWMLDTDTFSHTGVDGSSSRARIESAGYELEGSWRTGENIGWVSEGGADGLSDEVIRLHENLMNSPGHRANILNPDFEEVGLGIEEGDFARPNGSVDAVFVTQNFGTTDAVADAPVADAAVVDQTPAMPEAVLDVMPDVPATPEPQEQAPAAADLDFGSFDAFMASFRDVRPSMVDAGNDMDSESSGFMTTTGSTISGVTVTSTADTVEGPTTDIEGEGTFTGTGTATVDMETATDTQSGGADETDTVESSMQIVETATPAEEPVIVSADSEIDNDESGFTTTTGSTTSGVTVTSTADTVDGPTTDIEGEGTFAGTGTATVDTETATDTQSGGAVGVDAAEPAVQTVETAATTGFSVMDFFRSDSFIFNRDADFTMTSGSSVSSGVVQASASTQNGVSVDILEMIGNVDLFGSAANGTQSVSDAFASTGFDFGTLQFAQGDLGFDAFSF